MDADLDSADTIQKHHELRIGTLEDTYRAIRYRSRALQNSNGASLRPRRSISESGSDPPHQACRGCLNIQSCQHSLTRLTPAPLRGFGVEWNPRSISH
jgi:hypothetical protein